MSAMTTAESYGLLVEWVRDKIAAGLSYLVPPDDGRVEGYVPSYASPTVFEQFVPSAERLADGEAPVPSIVVQSLKSGDRRDGTRAESIRLVLIIWAPGNVHAEGDGLTRDMGGWRDLMNGLEAMREALLDAEDIGGRALEWPKNGDAVTVGPLDEDGVVEDTWPFWRGKCEFSLMSGHPEAPRFDRWL